MGTSCVTHPLIIANSNMFSRMKNFFVNHRRGIAIGGLVVGGSVLAIRYAQRKLHEYQLDQAKAFLEKTRRTQHFEATERTCNQVITNLAPTLCEEILAILNTEEILEQLRKNPENKTELWNELKVLSFARLTTLVYASSMLVIALRVQVNLVSGYVYKDNVPDSRGSSSPPNQLLPSDFMQTYLSEIQYFLKEGVARLARSILEVTRKILQDCKLKKQLTLTDMEQIFWAIQMSVNADAKDPNGHIHDYIFNRSAEPSHNPTIQQLVTETVDVLDSEEVAVLASNNVSRGFSVVIDHLAEYLTETVAELQQKNSTVANGNGDHRVTNPNSIQMALAKLIPIVNGLTAKPFNMSVTPSNLATSLVNLFMLSDKVKMLGVNVYELFST